MAQTILLSSAAPPNHSSATKPLLALGVVAGPIYVLVSLVQGLTRDGFDFTRHAWSLLANGDYGWIHVANLITAGLLTTALAVGVRRRAGLNKLVSRLIGAYGLSLLGAGVFRADPAMGFPPGAPDNPEATWHGILHFTASGIGFFCLVAACFVVARRFAAEGNKDWATYSRTTGILFLAGFAAAASGATGAGPNLAFTAAVVIAWTWVSALAAHLYRTT